MCMLLFRSSTVCFMPGLVCSDRDDDSCAHVIYGCATSPIQSLFDFYVLPQEVARTTVIYFDYRSAAGYLPNGGFVLPRSDGGYVLVSFHSRTSPFELLRS